MGIKSTKRIVMTLLAGLILTLLPQVSPAVAAPGPILPSGEVVCFLQFRNGILVGIKCIAFRPIWPDCIKCDALAFDYGDIYVHDRLVDGFVQLDKAAHATDPRLAETYRRAALDRFMTVAVAVSRDITRDTGYVDRRTGRFVSERDPGLVEAGADIDAGLRLLRQGAQDPDGDPILPIEQGMERLGNAYQRLASGR
jgi:hypothetical protein